VTRCPKVGSCFWSSAYYRSWRLVAIVGTTIDVCESAVKPAELGCAGTRRGDGSVFPQLRIVGIGEAGTHAVIAGQWTPTRRARSSGKEGGRFAHARDALSGAPELYGPSPFSEAAKTDAALLGRAKSNAVLPVSSATVTDLRLRARGTRRQVQARARHLGARHKAQGRRPSTAPNRGQHLPPCRTILDPARARPEELAVLYAERWEIESIFDELKTRGRGPRMILGSRTPSGVSEEVWGYLSSTTRSGALIAVAADIGGRTPTV
jgi:hypothetical protein